MNREEFLRNIFSFFGKNDEDLLRTYDLALTTREQIDWDKLYKKVITEVVSRYLPAPSWFIAMFPCCPLKVDGQYKYDSGTGVLRLKDRFYVFDMWHTTHTTEEISRNFKNKYEGNFISFKYYPENFKIIGRNIFDTSSGKMELHEVIQ